jgi:hypothetical protein
MKFYLLRSLLVFLLFTFTIQAQENKEQVEKEPKKDIDPSNPTNLYTQVNFNPEYEDGKNADLYGVRVNIQYAFNADNLVLMELPFLHNEATSKT